MTTAEYKTAIATADKGQLSAILKTIGADAALGCDQFHDLTSEIGLRLAEIDQQDRAAAQAADDAWQASCAAAAAAGANNPSVVYTNAFPLGFV
jgi:hypothetical protein